MADRQVHWAEDPSKLPVHVDQMQNGVTARLNLDRFLIRLYHGRPVAVPAMDVTRPSSALMDLENAKVGGFSLVRQVGDAAAALVVRMPAVKVLPVGQQFKRQRGAKLMSRYLNGVFYDAGVKAIAPALFIDAITNRVGALKWYVDKKAKKVKCERLNPLWLMWDDAEGPQPKCLYYVAPASKRFLAATFTDKALDIEGAPVWNPSTISMVGFQRRDDADRVKVIEAWSLPMGNLPGRHVIMLQNGAKLLDEGWEFEKFPVVAYRWSEGCGPEGQGSWGGRPLAEVLLPYQLWTNKITRIMGESSKAAVPKVLLHENSEVTNQIADKIMEHIRWRGPIKPEVIVPTTIGVDLWKLREIIKAEAYEEGGVNQAIAQGRTSDNLKSAPAQRERMDIASTRLIHPTERFEAFWKDCAEVVMMLAAKHPTVRTRSRIGHYMSEIDWKDIELAEGEAVVEIHSTAALPLTIGGRMDTVADLLQMKDDDGRALIKARDGLKMLQMPDTDAVLDRETAAQDLADYQVEQALWEGKFIPPEDIQDIDLLIKTASQELMRALQNETFPDENLELCRRLIAEAKLMVPAPAAAPGMPMPGMPAAPGAPGGQAAAVTVGATPGMA